MANIRGSAGYGKDFEELIKTGWGVDDLKDLVAGARYMIDSELADPNRIGATGQSYGGSMSMEIACSAPQGLFQASISRTGYADWGYYHKHGSQRTVKLLSHSLGEFDDNQALYEVSAALNKVQNAQTPVFVIDQETDPTEPHPDRRHEFVAQLRGLGKPVTYKSYKNTGGPYARHPSGAKEMLPDMIAFFKKHLG
jgi:dipeptidyl aminopeptidase/acylaminoacyl peptidase